jgi:hypothetical protein
VAAPVGENATRLAPALTVHYGQRRTQIFAGLLFMPSDALSLPADSVRFPREIETDQFIVPGGRTALNLFVGIVLNGVIAK